MKDYYAIDKIHLSEMKTICYEIIRSSKKAKRRLKPGYLKKKYVKPYKKACKTLDAVIFGREVDPKVKKASIKKFGVFVQFLQKKLTDTTIKISRTEVDDYRSKGFKIEHTIPGEGNISNLSSMFLAAVSNENENDRFKKELELFKAPVSNKEEKMKKLEIEHGVQRLREERRIKKNDLEDYIEDDREI